MGENGGLYLKYLLFYKRLFRLERNLVLGGWI